MSKSIWKIGYRFNDKTGEKRPWEVVNQVHECGRLTRRVQWGSFKTEASAAASIPKAIARIEASPSHTEAECQNIGRIDQAPVAA